jgi:hypothetical protein
MPPAGEDLNYVITWLIARRETGWKDEFLPR